MNKPDPAPQDAAVASMRTSSLLTPDGKAPRRPKVRTAPPAILTRQTPAAQTDDPEVRRQPQAGGRGSRALAVVPTSYDATARTVEVILSSGAAVDRYYFTEELEISAEAIDLGRVDRGVCPLLDAHNQYEIDAVIGNVTAARIEGEQLIGIVSFADNERGRDIEARVARGELRAISIGYRVTKWQLTMVDDNDRETWRAVTWELLEASLVPVPADANAVVRSESGSAHGSIEKEEDMRRNLPGGAAAAAPAVIPAPTIAAPAAADPVRSEPAAASVPAPEPATPAADPARGVSIARIREQCSRTADLGDTFALELIEANERSPLSEADLMSRVADRLITARARPTADVRGGNNLTDGDGYRSALEASIILRSDPSAQFDASVVAAASEFRGMTLMEMARDYLQRTGIRTSGMGRMEIAGAALGMRYGALSTSDFANVLSSAASKRIRQAFNAAPQTFGQIISRGTLPDFKPSNIIGLGDAPALLLVPENGEFKRGAISDTGQSYQLRTYGRIIAITRQAIVNDDKSLFGRIPTMFGRKAADLESDLVWGLITSNPTMSDGVALFHASHGNLAPAGAAIDATSVAEGETAMLQQKTPEGGFLIIRPEYLIVGAAKKVEAQKFLTAVTATKTSDVNPYPGNLQLIVEPRITGNQWYLAADPSAFDTIELSHLDGQEELFIDSRVGFDVDGVETKARLDVGGTVIDYRGFWKNPGN